jgi:hypothetical protein
VLASSFIIIPAEKAFEKALAPPEIAEEAFEKALKLVESPTVLRTAPSREHRPSFIESLKH